LTREDLKALFSSDDTENSATPKRKYVTDTATNIDFSTPQPKRPLWGQGSEGYEKLSSRNSEVVKKPLWGPGSEGYEKPPALVASKDSGETGTTADSVTPSTPEPKDTSTKKKALW
jgi:hypothetical protein